MDDQAGKLTSEWARVGHVWVRWFVYVSNPTRTADTDRHTANGDLYYRRQLHRLIAHASLFSILANDDAS